MRKRVDDVANRIEPGGLIINTAAMKPDTKADDSSSH